MATERPTISNSDLSLMSRPVARGAKAMDEIDPQWYRKVKITHLDMRNGRACILGQTMDGFWEALRKLGKDEPWATRNGLLHSDTLSERISIRPFDSLTVRQYEVLTQMWANEIRIRRGNAPKAVFV